MNIIRTGVFGCVFVVASGLFAAAPCGAVPADATGDCDITEVQLGQGLGARFHYDRLSPSSFFVTVSYMGEQVYVHKAACAVTETFRSRKRVGMKKYRGWKTVYRATYNTYNITAPVREIVLGSTSVDTRQQTPASVELPLMLAVSRYKVGQRLQGDVNPARVNGTAAPADWF